MIKNNHFANEQIKILETEILAKEGHHVLLEAIGDRAGVRARIDLEAVRDSILIQNIVQFSVIDTQAILVTNVQGDRVILLEIRNVLVHEDQRCIRGPLSQHLRLRRSILHRQLKIEGRILRIWRPCCSAGKLDPLKEK